MTTQPSPATAEDGKLKCPEHPDVELLHVAGTYETGVVAPDGGKEYQWGEGFYCDWCNCTYDESDLLREAEGDLMELGTWKLEEDEETTS